MTNINSDRSVVITGASTGIGRGCALHMDRLGWRVFAGIRKPADGASLCSEASERLMPVMLDVTDPDSITEASRLVAASLGDEGLSGLVNNAGIPYGGPVEFLDLAKLRHAYEVNFFGLIAVTQAFLPLLRAARGRIVNMSSNSGMIATPFTTPYSSSKWALEAMSDSLRVELHPWKMHVSVVQPGAIDTPIWDKASKVAYELVNGAPQAGHDLYGQAMETMAARYVPHGISTDYVSRAVAHALTSDHPKTRYPVGSDAVITQWISRLPDRLRDWLIISRLPKWG